MNPTCTASCTCSPQEPRPESAATAATAATAIAASSTVVLDAAGPINAPRRGFTRAALASLALVGGGVLVLGTSEPARAATALGDEVRWPESITLLDGSVLTAAQLRGTAVLVVFFSTTCPYCARHNPHVQKLVAATAGLPLRVIGVAQDKSAEAVRTYVRSHAYTFAVTQDARALHEALSPRKVIPLSCVIDPAGRLREVIPGEMFEEDVLELARWARA